MRGSRDAELEPASFERGVKLQLADMELEDVFNIVGEGCFDTIKGLHK